MFFHWRCTWLESLALNANNYLMINSLDYYHQTLKKMNYIFFLVNFIVFSSIFFYLRLKSTTHCFNQLYSFICNNLLLQIFLCIQQKKSTFWLFKLCKISIKKLDRSKICVSIYFTKKNLNEKQHEDNAVHVLLYIYIYTHFTRIQYSN